MSFASERAIRDCTANTLAKVKPCRAGFLSGQIDERIAHAARDAEGDRRKPPPRNFGRIEIERPAARRVARSVG